jgi:hypothetical protein
MTVSWVDAEHHKRLAVAHHEAGHAVLAIEYRRPFRHVLLVTDRVSLGRVRYSPGWSPKTFMPDVFTLDDDPFQTACIREALITLAGPAAEERFTGRPNVGSVDDFRYVRDLVYRVCGEGEEEPFLRYLNVRARNLIARPVHWARVKALAAALMNKLRIDAAAARLICQEALAAARRQEALTAGCPVRRHQAGGRARARHWPGGEVLVGRRRADAQGGGDLPDREAPAAEVPGEGR